MEREIKFRAWDGTKYITFDNHQYDLIYNDISGWNICPNLPNYKGEWTTGESSSSAKSFKLEQFTGLKDKNGLEIYEGDVCKTTFYNHATPNSELTQKVIFVQGGFALMSIGKDFENIIIDHDLSFVPLYYSQAPNRIEVIGNIHETPELLKH